MIRAAFLCIFSKKSKKIKKNAKKFARIKKTPYLCTVKQKETTIKPRRQRVTSGKKVMKRKVTKEKVVARIVKGGFAEKDARKMVSKFWELSKSRGCETVYDFYMSVKGFWAVG